MDIGCKICDICLKTYSKTYAVDCASFKHINKVLGFKESNINLLCTWCRSTLRRLNKFLTMVEANLNKLDTDTSCIDIEINDYNCGVYNLSIQINNTLDIPNTFEEIFIGDDVFCNESALSNDNIKDNDKELNCEEKFDMKELCSDLSKEKKNFDYGEPSFDVNYLSIDEQREEIEGRKRSQKYQKMAYKCDLCHLGFLTEDVFDGHLKRHDQVSGPHKCTICHLRFKSPLVLSQHKLSHSRRFICTQCGAKLKRWSHTLIHREKCPKNLVVNSEICNFCGKIFSNRHSMEVHIKGVHERDKKYACERCGRRFSTKQRLNIHMRSHTGTKPFACDICGSCFATNSNLRSHATVHQADKKYFCVECNTRYKTQRALKKHFLESSKHTRNDDKLHKCPDCPKRFPTEKTLQSHVRVRHKTKYSCDTCNKIFSSNSNLNKHIRCIHSTGK